MQLDEEFSELIAALQADGLEYAVVGGLAVAIWGAPRATTDIDLLIRRADLARALNVAKQRGFDVIANPMKFTDGGELCRATKFDGGEQLTLDLMLISADHPYWLGREQLPFGSGVVWVVSRETLIQMKASAARPQDIADILKLRDVDR